MQAASPAALPETQALQQGWVAVNPQHSSLPDQHSQTGQRQVITSQRACMTAAQCLAPQVDLLDERQNLPVRGSRPKMLGRSLSAPKLFWAGEMKCRTSCRP